MKGIPTVHGFMWLTQTTSSSLVRPSCHPSSWSTPQGKKLLQIGLQEAAPMKCFSVIGQWKGQVSVANDLTVAELRQVVAAQSGLDGGNMLCKGKTLTDEMPVSSLKQRAKIMLMKGRTGATRAKQRAVPEPLGAAEEPTLPSPAETQPNRVQEPATSVPPRSTKRKQRYKDLVANIKNSETPETSKLSRTEVSEGSNEPTPYNPPCHPHICRSQRPCLAPRQSEEQRSKGLGGGAFSKLDRI